MSILAVDFGSIHTRAVLIDQVSGVYQLVARAQTRTTDSFPVNDISVGFDRVLREISAATGRTFTGATGAIITPETADRTGVDVFVATASMGRPMRTIVVGLVPNLSVESALRAASGTYAEIVSEIHLNDGRTEQDRLNEIILNSPDVIMLAGGVDGGAKTALRQMTGIARLAVSMIDAPRRPLIIYGGNAQFAAEVEAAFEGVTAVFMGRNVRPNIDDEQIASTQKQFAHVFDAYKERQSRAFSTIADMSASGVTPTSQAYNTVVQYLGRKTGKNVMAVDIGSASSIAISWTDKRLNTTIRTDLGLGHNASALLNSVGLGAVKDWLPFYIRNSELQNYAANKQLRPMTIAATLRETYIEHAMMRAAAEALIGHETNRQYGTIISAGSTLTGTGDAGYNAMLTLDVVQPIGMTRLLSDPFGLLCALGAAAAQKPEAIVQILDGSSLEPLGTAFSINGQPRIDRPAMRIHIKFQNGTEVKQTIDGGHVWVCPLPTGETADVRVSALRGTNFGKSKKIRARVEGGTAGLIFDARGRALMAGKTVEERAKRMPVWISDSSDAPHQDIPTRWLNPEEAEETEAVYNQPLDKIDSSSKRTRKDEKRAKPEPKPRRQRGKKADNAAPEAAEEDDPLKELRDATLS